LTEQSSTIVQRLWNYCNVLRDDGVSYGDYVEQLTYLLFLKMDDEQAQVLGKPSAIRAAYAWDSLRRLEAALEQFRAVAEDMGGLNNGLVGALIELSHDAAYRSADQNDFICGTNV